MREPTKTNEQRTSDLAMNQQKKATRDRVARRPNIGLRSRAGPQGNL